MSLSDELQALHDSGDVGEAVEGLALEAEKLEDENRQLKAQVEQLRIALVVTRQPHMDYIPNLDKTAQQVLDATPTQCLAEVKAQAVEGFYKALMRSPNISVTGKEIISGIWLCSPVRELSQQAKAGE